MTAMFPLGSFNEGDRVKIVSNTNPSSGNYTDSRSQRAVYRFSSNDSVDLFIAERFLLPNTSLRSPPSTNNVVYYLQKSELPGPYALVPDPEGPQLRANEVIPHSSLLDMQGNPLGHALVKGDGAIVARGTRISGKDFSGRTVKITDYARSWNGARNADASQLKPGSGFKISYPVQVLKRVPTVTSVYSSHTFRHDELVLI